MALFKKERDLFERERASSERERAPLLVPHVSVREREIHLKERESPAQEKYKWLIMDTFGKNFDKAPGEPQSNSNFIHLQRDDDVCETMRQITCVTETLRKDPGRCGMLEETVSKICNDVRVVEENSFSIFASRGNVVSEAETESSEKAKVKSEMKSILKASTKAKVNSPETRPEFLEFLQAFPPPAPPVSTEEPEVNRALVIGNALKESSDCNILETIC